MKAALNENLLQLLTSTAFKRKIDLQGLVDEINIQEVDSREQTYPQLQAVLLSDEMTAEAFLGAIDKAISSWRLKDKIKAHSHDSDIELRAIKSLIQNFPEDNDEAGSRIDQFIEIAFKTGKFHANDGNADKSSIVFFCSILLTAAFPDRFVDFRRNRWQNLAKNLGYNPLKSNASYGEWIVWAGRFAQDIAPTPTFQRYWRNDHPLWAVAGLSWHLKNEKISINDASDENTKTKKLEALLSKKKQIILYGPPGTGKTWHAKNLLSKNGETSNKIEFITFHPSFGYEEFIEGLRPNTDENGSLTFHIHDGIFKQFAQAACNILFKEAGIDKQWLPEGDIPSLDDDEKKRILETAPSVPFYLIIDEINRGDISRIFGELITLLEADKRYGEVNEITTTLPYSKTSFAIPPNLYLIGTMNTADKSIALVDTALRRRFGFIEMMPDYELLHRLFAGVPEDVKPVADLATSLLEEINTRIRNRYDRDHQIGHSYLVPLKDAKTRDEAVEILHSAWYYEILPLLQEYFYDSPKKLHEVIGNAFVSVEGDHSFCFTDKLVGEVFIEAVEGIIFPDSGTRIEEV